LISNRLTSNLRNLPQITQIFTDFEWIAPKWTKGKADPPEWVGLFHANS
jgi:hypothetical protein